VPEGFRIRDPDDEVYRALVRRAAEAGVSVPDLLGREATRLAPRLTVQEWLERTRHRPSTISRAEVLEAFEELRGLWPGADR